MGHLFQSIGVLQRLEPLGSLSGRPNTLTGIDLSTLYPLVALLRYTANLWGHRLTGRPKRGVVLAVLLDHASSTLAGFGEKVF